MKIYLATVNVHTGEKTYFKNFHGDYFDFNTAELAQEQIALLKKTGGWMGYSPKEPENFRYEIEEWSDDQNSLVHRYERDGFVVSHNEGKDIIMETADTHYRLRITSDGQVWKELPGAEYKRIK